MTSRTMKFGLAILLLATGGWLGGCGSSNANVVTVTVSPSAPSAIIAGQQEAFTATVAGSTTLTVTWTCTFTTTTVDPTTGKSTTSAAAPCTASEGSYTVSTDTTVLTYTAPELANFPNPIPAITLTATADANKSKTGTATFSLDSGIRVSITPTTVNIPVGSTTPVTEKFIVTLLNAAPTDIQYLLVQPNASSTIVSNQSANPQAATCSPNCGMMDSAGAGVYTAPTTYPTDTTPPQSTSAAAAAYANIVYLVAWSKRDINEYAIAQITLVNIATTNSVTFDGIFPSTLPAGGVVADVFLDAKNLLNTTPITFTDPLGTVYPLNAASGQVYTIPITAAYCTSTTTLTCDASTVTRVRLNSQQLANPGVASIQVANIPDSAHPGQFITKSMPLNLTYASPAVVASVPDSFPFPTNSNTAGTTFGVDGGYFGGGSSPIVRFEFNGTTAVFNSGTQTARQLTGPLNASQIQNPGLYPITISSVAPVDGVAPFNPPPFPTVTTNVAVQPNFADLTNAYGLGNTPAAAAQNCAAPNSSYPACVSLPAGANSLPSSMVINPIKNYALITELGTSSLDIADISTGKPVFTKTVPLTCTLAGAATPCYPTSVAYTDNLQLVSGQDTAVVVNSGAQSLSLIAVPSGTFISQIDLSGLLTSVLGGSIPTPYSIGIDPGTNLALVAYSNSNIGFVVDLSSYTSGTQPTPCFNPAQTAPCAIASVSMVTGPTPQVIMQPNVPLAYITPGGAGNTTVINLLATDQMSTVAAPAVGAVRTNNVVTIVTTTPHGINPATGGTVLVTGVMTTAVTSGTVTSLTDPQNNMNGTYQVNAGSVVDPYTFSYTQAAPQGATLGNLTGGNGTVQYGSSYYAFNTTATAVGGAINPITRSFAYADPNARSSQINFIETLDQSVNSATLLVNQCDTCPTTNPTAPEIGFRYVAFDPFTNVALTFNPKDPNDEISFVNPGGPTASGTTRTATRISPAVPTGQVGIGTYTPAGATNPVNVYGGFAYNPNTRLVLAANAGSGSITYFNINPGPGPMFRVPQVSGIQVTQGGIANAQPPLKTSTTPNPPVAVCQPSNAKGAYSTCLPLAVTLGQSAALNVYGVGFKSGGTVAVRLDGDSTGVTVTQVVSDSQLQVSIDPSRLTVPHDYALDVTVGGVASNTTDLFVIDVISLNNVCTTAPAQPEGVAIDENLLVAVVTNYGCNSVSFINLDTTGTKYAGKPYGSILSTLTVGKGPIGVDVLPRLGLAVTANNLAGPPGTASIIDMHDPMNPVLKVATDINVGISPTGVAIDQDHAFALIANNGSNTVSVLDLTVLYANPVGTITPATVAAGGAPTAISIDPDRAKAVVTTLQNSGTTAASAGVDVVDISVWPPVRDSSSSITGLTALASGLAYDPAVSPALFYVTSSQLNLIYSFNPDTGGITSTAVGINPFSLAYNYQTGTLFTVNAGTTPPVDGTVLTQNQGSSSVVDTQTAKTRATLGISSQSQFAAAMQNLTNTVVMVDQNNNRVLIIPMPK